MNVFLPFSTSANCVTSTTTSFQNNSARLGMPSFLRWFFVLLMFVSVGAQAQTISATTYPMTVGTTTVLEDMSGVTTQLVAANIDDGGGVGVVNIGFDFWFNGTRYTQFAASANGFVRLGSGGIPSSDWTNAMSTTTFAPILAPYWDDLWTGTNGQVHYKVVGSAPNRKMIVEWQNEQIPRGGSGASGAGTFQLWIFETTGKIEYVYGTGVITNAANSGYSVGLANSTTLFASVTTTTNTVSYSAANNAQTNAIPAGTSYTFTPIVPVNSVSGLSFSSVGLSSMTLNWTVPGSTAGIVLYAIYNSTDGGTTFNYAGQTANNAATSFTATGLAANTNYTWRVYSVSEGALSSSFPEETQATNACSVAGGTYSVGPTGTYATLTAAITALSNGGLLGPVILELQSTYVSTGETFPIVLSNLSCATAVNNIIIRPETGATGLSITGANATATINITGGNYFTIDGRPGGVGTTSQLTIGNTSTTGVPVQFINDASNNAIRYVSFTGGNTSVSGGLIRFSTGTVTGNDNNTIEHNDFNGNGTNLNLIYNLATTAISNDNVMISNNLFHDQFSAGSATHGLNISTGASAWTINANSFYQSATRTYTTGNTHTAINISNSGVGFIITNNSIGGNDAAGAGTWTLGGTTSTRFVGIQLSAAATTASTIQGNTIRNFNLSSSSGATTLPGVWCGIYISSGAANITGNTIGATTGTGSIVSTSSTTGAVSAGIGSGSTSTGNITVSNNTIGAVTVAGTGVLSHTFNAIWNSSSITGAYTVSGNTIGSTTTPGSIQYATAGTGTTAAVLTGILQTATPTLGAFITNNTIANFVNNYVPAAANSASVMRGIWASSGRDSIAGNTIYNFTTAANSSGNGSTGSVIGIGNVSSTAGASYIRANTIHSLSNTHPTAAAYVTGIFWNGATGGMVDRNLIYSLTSPSSIALVNGIHIGGSTTTYQNNMIRLGIDAAGASTTNSTNYNGILETAGTNNIWNNTVYIGGSGVAAAVVNSYAFYNNATLTTTRSIRNNIFINERSNAAAGGSHYAVRIGGTTVNPTGLTINNNLYRATGTGGVFGFYNAANVADLAAWQAAVGQDANSTSVNPCLADPTAATPDLHLTNCGGAGNPADGIGFNVGVVNDYDNQTRADFTPVDLGADAGNYGAVGSDVGLSVLVSPGPATGCYTNAEAVTVTLKNYGLNTIDFSVDPVTITVTATGPVAYTSNIVINTGTLASNGTQNVTLPLPYDMSQRGTYTFNGSAVVAGDVNNVNNVLPTTVRVYNVLSGAYNVGTGGDFVTLTAAIAAYNTANGETFPLTITNQANASAVNTLTIKPAAGVTALITSSASTINTLRIINNNYVIIDGSNNGTNTRDLTISNTSVTTPGVVLIGSTGTTPITNVTVKNTILINGINTNTAVIVSDAATAGNPGYFNNITIQNNSIQKAYMGIYATAVVAAGNGSGLNITGNSLNSTGADAIRYVGIYMQGVDGASITNNLIGNFNNVTSEVKRGMWLATEVKNTTVSGNTISGIDVNASGASNPVGINLTSTINNANISITNNTISSLTGIGTGSTIGINLLFGSGGFTFTGNRISDIKNASTTTGSAVGIALNTTSTSANTLVANNFIFDIAGNGGANNGAGISVITGAGYSILYNSINLGTAQTVASTTGTAAISIAATVVDAGAIDLRNNILANTQTSGGKHYSIYSAAPNTVFSAIDYNDYYTTGDNLGFIGTDRSNLAAMQAGFGGNTNSKNVLPVFLSPTDLHLNTILNINLNGSATPVASVTTDIDGNTRNATAPDMGADEFDPMPGLNVGLESLVLPGSNGCYTNAETVTVVLRNSSIDPIDFSVDNVTVNVTATGGYNSTLVLTSGTLASGASMNVILPATIDMTTYGSFVFNGSATVVGDIYTANDAMPATTRVSVAPAAGTVSVVSPAGRAYCITSGRPVLNLSSATGGAVQWQESTVSGTGPWTNVGTDSLRYTAPNDITVTTYYRALVSCGANTATSNVDTVTYNNPSVVSTTPGSRCGTGSVPLSATGSGGSVLNWYAASSGGTALGTGTTFNTPVISANTTYYVAAASGAGLNEFGGKLTTSGADGNFIGTGYGIVFDATTPYTIASAVIYPVGTGDVTFALYNSAGVELAATAAIPVTGTGITTPVTVPINLSVTPGTGYRLLVKSFTGLTGIIRDFTGLVFPYTFPSGAMSVTAGYNGAITTGAYYFFYNINISSGCSSERTPVLATVTTASAIVATGTPATICSGSSATLNVTSDNANYAYQWMPGAMNGASQVVSPATTTTYTVTATDTIGNPLGCVALADVTITVNPSVTAVTASASATTLCVGNTVNLFSSANSGENSNVSVTEGFESGLPSGWAVLQGGSGNLWTVPATPTGGARTGTRAAEYLYNVDFDANTWMFTNGMSLAGGVTYTISYWEKTSTFSERLKVTVGTAQTIAAQTTILQDLGSHTASAAYVQRTTTFTPATSGTYYFAWNAYSFSDEYYINIDDIAISGAVAVAPTYTWSSVPAGFTSNVQNPTGVAQSVNTVYTVTANNSFNCPATASVTVNMSDLAVSATATDVLCNGGATGTITATATGGITPYEYSINNTTWQSSNSFTGLAAGSYTIYVRDASTPQCVVTGNTVIISEPSSAVTVTIVSSTDPVCNNGSTGTITASATGGTGLIEYSLDGIVYQASGAFTGLASGPYTVYARDASGCTGTTTTTLNNPPLPAVTATSNSPVCEGSNATLTATAGFTTYTWSGPGVINNNDQQVATAVAPADGNVYTVTVTDANGCSNSATVTVNVNANQPVSVSLSVSPATEVCSGSEVTFTATPTNGGATPNYQFFLNAAPVQNGPSATYVTSTLNDQDAVYVIITSSEACTTGSPATSNTITMTISGIVFADVTVTASPAGTVCSGTSVTYTANPTAGGPTPTFEFFVNNVSVQNGTSTTYTTVPANGDQLYVVMTSSFDCAIGSPATSATTTTTVAPTPATPVVTAGSTTTFCNGGSVTLTSDNAGAGNQWYLDGNEITGATSPSYIATVSGSYTVVYTLGACPSAISAAVVVTVNANPTASITGANTYCSGNSTLLTADALAGSGTIDTYQWTLDGTTLLGTASTQAANQVGSYTVTVTNTNGCSVTSAPFAVTEIASPVAGVTASCTTLYPGQTATLTATPATGVTYEWTLDGGPVLSTANPYITAPGATGTYAVKVTDNVTSCFSIATVVINAASGPLAGGSTFNIPDGCGGFPTIASAAAYLNANGVSGTGPVTFNVAAGYTETAIAGGIVFGSATLNPTLNSTVPVIFQKGGAGANPVVTAFTPQASGSILDAVIKLTGADYITFNGIDVTENAANTTTATATNDKTEFGYALLYLNATDGSQNNTIMNSGISLTRTYANSMGIYSNVRHTATAATVIAEITAASGSNSGNKFYTNNISNVNNAIVLIGSGSATTGLQDNGNDIGGTAAGTGNTITNAGGVAWASPFVGALAANYIIYSANQYNDNISHNTITSVTGVLTTTVQTGGILKLYSAQPTGTITTDINNNTITVSAAPTTGAVIGINNQGLLALATATVNINNNRLIGQSITGAQATSASHTGITNLSIPGTLNINSNEVRGYTSSATTGGFVAISNGGAVVNAININNNQIGNSTGGALTFAAATTGICNAIQNTGGAATSSLNINGNNIQGFSFVSAGSVTGILNTSGNLSGVAVNINNNTLGSASGNYVSYSAANSAALNGISNAGGAGSALSITGNDIRGIVHAVAGSNTQTYIGNSATTLSQNISNNTFTNLNVNTTGSITFITNSVSAPAAGFKTINGNSIVTAFNKGGSGGTVALYTDGGSSVTTTPVQNMNNNFSNITVTGATVITGWFNNDGTGATPAKTITGNTFTNWTGGTSAMTALQSNFGGAATISNNTITSISGQGAITGLLQGGSGTNASLIISNNSITGLTSTGTGGSVTGMSSAIGSSLLAITNNTITTLSSTGTASTVAGLVNTGATTSGAITGNVISGLTATGITSPVVTGMSSSAGAALTIQGNTIHTLSNSGPTSPLVRGILISGGTTVNVARNKIYNLLASGASTSTAGIVAGITLSGGTTVNTVNNIIGDLRATAANSLDVIRGINVTSTSGSTNQNVYYNTVYLNAASSGSAFGTSGIYHTTSATATTARLTLRNNIIVNNSTPGTTGFTAAYRRSSATLTNYNATSNNNLYYAGVPAANRVIFYDGTNSDQTLAAFKTRMATRDQQSVTENPTFVSTTGSDPTYLHINSTVPTVIEGGAENIAGVTDDFDGDIRQGNPGYTGASITKPDIGADELDATPLPCTGATGGTATVTTFVCSPTTATVVSASGTSSGGGITYQWQVSATTGTGFANVTDGSGANTLSYTTPAGLAPGTYYYRLEVICSADPLTPGYSTEALLTVRPTPTAVASNNGPVCSGNNITLTGTTDIANIYLWTGPNGYTSSNQSPTFSAPANGSGRYYFTATLNGCSKMDSTDVVINETPTAVVVTPTSAVLCEGSVQTLSATGGDLPAATPITVLNENFNAPTNTWTKINNSTAGTPAASTWTLRASGFAPSETLITPDASQFYLSNSDAQGSGSTTATILQSPAFSTVGYSTLNVLVNHYYRHTSSTANVEASTDGTTWTTLQSFTATSGAPAAFATSAIALTPAFVNQPSVFLRFKYDATWGWYWAINNVSVVSPQSAPITWSPATNLYTDAAATIPYAGENLATVYAKPSVSQVYTATATNGTCTASATSSIVINPLPNSATITGTTTVCQNTAAPVITFTAGTGTAPYTFTYNINGGAPLTVTSGGGANPVSVTVPVSTATGGTFTYTLTGIADIYCTNTASGTATVTVTAAPVVSFTGLNPVYCLSDAASTLSSNQAGGTFSGPGVTDNGNGTGAFNPATAGAGTHSVTFSYTDIGTGCTSSTTQSVTVNPLPVVSFTGLAAAYCSNNAPVTLTANNAGGTFTGAGITDNGNGTASFDPATAGAGTHTITYSYTDANTCSGTTTQSVTVDAAPNATITYGALPYCSNDETASPTLTGTTGGTYSSTAGLSINAITGIVDLPASTPGSYTVTYTIAASAGCGTYTTTAPIVINPAPAAPSISSVNNGDGTYTLTASGYTGTLLWSTSETTPSITISSPGVYTVTTTAANGCTSNPATFTLAGAITADPAVIGLYITDAGNNTIDPNVMTFGTTYNLNVPVYNLHQLNFIPAGTGKIVIDLGTKMTLSGPLSTPLSAYFTWTSAVVGGHLIITGDQTGNIPADFIGSAAFAIEGSGSCVSTIVANWIVDNHAGAYTLTDEDPTNNNTTLQYGFPVTVTATAVNVTCFGAANGDITTVASPGTVITVRNASNQVVTAPFGPGTYTVTATGFNDNPPGGICSSSTIVTITEPATAVTATSTGTNATCFTAASGTATAQGAGGTGPYTYSWNTTPVQTTQTATGLTAGTYTATVTDANGCTAFTSVTITQPTSLTATATGTNNSCFGGSTGTATVVASNGTAPYNYSWNTVPEQTTATATGLAAGTYIVTVTDAGGCSVQASYTVTQPAAGVMVATSGTAVSCFGGSNGTATATATGGTAPYSYSWNTTPVQTTAIATGLAAGTYTVTVTDAGGCSASATFEVLEPAAALAATTTTTAANCFGQSNGTATANVTGGTGAYSYSWNTTPVQTTATATGLAAGNYTVTVTDANGCTTTQSATVAQPALLTSTGSFTNVTCNGSANGTATVVPSGGTAPYGYSWNTTPVQTTATATGLAAGTYTVTITDANGCARQQTFTITQPAALANTATITNVSCNGGTNGSAAVSVTGGTGPYTYSWSPSGGTSATASGLGAGSYTVTVTDANGCILTATYNITEPAVLAATGSGTNINCFGGTTGTATVAVTGGTAPYGYSWNTTPAQTTQTATGLAAGTYTVTVTDANGCITTASYTVTQPATAVSLSTTQTDVTCTGSANGTATVTATGGTAPYGYSWNTTPAQSTQTATGLAPGTYTVTVTDAAGCVQTASVTITQPASTLSATATGTNVTCLNAANGTATAVPAGGTAPYGYSWNTTPVQTTQTATGLAPGVYTVTITDAGGCTATASYTVTQPAAALAITTSNVINNTCHNGNAGSVTGTATGGTIAYAYTISGPVNTTGATSGIFTGLVAGTYTITVTDANGCTAAAAPVTITHPTGTVPDISLGSDYTANFFGTNGVTQTLLFNVAEIGGNPAVGDTIRIIKPSGYTFTFNNAATATTIGSTNYTLDNTNWKIDNTNPAFVSLIYDPLHNSTPGVLNCGTLVRITVDMTRNTPNIATFSLSARLRRCGTTPANQETNLNNNLNSIIFTAE